MEGMETGPRGEAMMSLQKVDGTLDSRARGSSHTHRITGLHSLAVPATILLILGLFLPLISLLGPGNLSYDVQVLSPAVTFRVQWTTLKIATAVALVVTLLGTCVALLLRETTTFAQKVVLAICVFPLGVNIAFRVFGVQFVIAKLEAACERILTVVTLGEVSPPSILFSQAATVIGLVHWLLPIAVLVVFSAVARIRQDLIDNAELLGAPPLAVLFRVVLPSIMGEILLCFVLSFCLAYGAYITPAALGGLDDITLTRLIGNLLNEGQGASAALPAVIGILTPLAAFGLGALLMRKFAYGNKNEA